MAERKLAPKQQLFVDEYLKDLNATQAAIRAGYSEPNADKIGPALLGNPRVAAAIQARQQARAERTELTQDEVIAGLRSEAAYKGPAARHAARVKAWELLGKHQGMFPDRVKLSGDAGEPPIQHEHSGTVTARIQGLESAFLGAAHRAGESGVPSDGTGKPLDS